MTLKPPYSAGPQESRWPVMLTVLGVVLLLTVLPDRVRLMASWGPLALGAVVLAPMLGVWVSRGQARWLRIERVLTLVFCAVGGVSVVLNLSEVIRAMLGGASHASGMLLLSSGCAVWANNVLVFSLLHWQLDAGGPEARADGKPDFCDWQFPQVAAPELVRPGWRPVFMDYLAIGFTTATAFSPTDVLPLTSRAKGLMMLESIISLVTIAVVASRAINVLGQ